MILNKKSCVEKDQHSFLKIGGDILSQSLEPVPSALRGLTSLFGMGRGGHPRNNHHKTITHGYMSQYCDIEDWERIIFCVKNTLELHCKKSSDN